MDIRIEAATSQPTFPKNVSEFGFGKRFTERMFVQQYLSEKGWHAAAIAHYKTAFPWLHPATSSLHYSQEIFEGMKAYRRKDGGVNLFRPDQNVQRFNNSATRMAMPEVPVDDHLEAIMSLIEAEQAWVPSASETSLYIRPTMIATDPELGVHASDSYLHYILLSLAGRYFPQGFSPVAVQIEDYYRRAAFGGTGEAKTGGNYSASLVASELAKEQGYSQVLWLDSQTGEYVEEVGSMNIMFVYGDTIVTPALSGSILHGITRDSILTLAPDLGYKVAEEQLSVAQILRDIRSGKITEAFGCGTAAVIAPIGAFGFKGEKYTVGDGENGAVTTILRDKLLAIQYGDEPDPYGWVKKVT